MKTKQPFDIDLQWFADPEPEIPEEEEIDFVTLGPGEEPPVEEPPVDDEKEQLRREVEELRKQNNSISAIQEGFNSLGDRLKVPPQPQVQQPVQKPQESDEEFQKRLNEDLFGQNSYNVLKEAVQRIVGPMVGNLGGATMKQAKTLMKLDPQKGQIYQKYENDIDAFIQTLPADAQSNPNVLEYAYNQVVSNNLDTIIEQQVQAKLEQGNTPEVNTTTTTVNGNAVPPPVGPGVSSVNKPANKRTVYITAAEERSLEKQSDMMGIPVDKLREQLIEEKQGR